MPKFRKKPETVEAICMLKDIPVSTGRGLIHVAAGEWLVTYPDGEQGIVDDVTFRRLYDPADRKAAEYLTGIILDGQSNKNTK